MCGDEEKQPAASGDDAWLRQYYTRAKAEFAPEPAPLLTPQPADKYGAPEPLGAGAEKEVVQVRDRDTLRDVALARPRAGHSQQAFIREARVLAQLEHPHIVPLHDLGLAPDGRPYFTMKLLAGETLEAVLVRLRQGDAATRGEFPLPALLDIFVRVCEAVAFAHARGVIHRDIKPANVQIGDYGDVRLLDWGLAQFLQDPAPAPEPAGIVKGTPGYMAPEQASGQGAADLRTDTYALGALLYALLPWYPPVTGETTTEILSKTVAGEIMPPQQRAPGRIIPHALAAMACKALATLPEDRYPTAEALLEDLQAFTNGYATAAEAAGPVRLLWLVLQRHRTVMLVLAASLLALTAVGIVAVQRMRASRDETRTALTHLLQEQALCNRLSRAAVPKLLAEARAQVRGLAYDDALETLRTAIGVDPAQTEAWEQAGWIYLGQERYELAAAAFRQEVSELVMPSPRPPVAATAGRLAATQTVAAAAGRGLPESGGSNGPGLPAAAGGGHSGGGGLVAAAYHRRRVAARKGGNDAARNAGLAVAERALLLRSDGPLAPEEFRALIEQARAVGLRQAYDSRSALGVYCMRHNPADWNQVAHVALVQWAIRVLNDGRAELELGPGSSGLEARVTGKAAIDLLPLAGLPLVRLDLHGTAVRDLQPLRGLPLQALDISGADVTNFEPIYGLPLRELRAEGFRKLPADLFARCPTLERVTVSPGTELSRKEARWPAGVKKEVMEPAVPGR